MKKTGIALIAAAILAGCASTGYDPYVAAVENQLQARSIQTRELEAASYRELMTAVISTLQDYHFRIGNIDPDLGTITATQVTDRRTGKQLTGDTSLTVLVRQRDETTYSVRVNMLIGLKVEETPELYQQFFAALQRKLYYRAAV